MTPRIKRALAIFLMLLLNANWVFPFASSNHVPVRGLTERTTPVSKLRPLRPLANRRPQEQPRREGETVTALPDGRLIIIGGESANGPLPSVTLTDPRSGEVTVLPNLQHARAWHSASILPDGRILILGGIGYGRNPLSAAEILDVETRTIQRLTNINLRARAYHSATLLTDGRILVAGGSAKTSTPLAEVELIDLKTNEVNTLAATLVVARQKHTATLLQDGSVAIQGGVESLGNDASQIELFDPNSRTFNVTSGFTESGDTYLAGSLPQSGAADVPIDSRVALRFSKEVRASWATPQTVVLSGPEGIVDSKVVPCERGKLVFVSPKTYLLPDVTSNFSIGEGAGAGSSATTISFHTSAGSPVEPLEGEDWIPGDKNLSGDWRSHRPDSKWADLPSLEAEADVTALSGQILLLNGNPLPDVTLKIGSATARTDQTGRFLLRAIPAGHQVLLVDGRSANKPNKAYGIFRIGVDITGARTNRLPFVIWMPKLDTRNVVTIPSPTNKETIIKTPYIPELELHIPAGSVIRGLDGEIVNKISITPIPIDRPPYPLPSGSQVPVFFTIQPGGAKLLPPRAQVYYPNYSKAKPGARVNFWRYDPEERGWYVYGEGTVTPNGKQVIPDSGVAIYEFGGIMIDDNEKYKPIPSPTARPTPPQRDPESDKNDPTDLPPGGDPPKAGGTGGTPTGPGSPSGSGSSGGDPVDLSSGLFSMSRTDLVVPDTIPIKIIRTYRPGDTYSRGFGIATRLFYDIQLWSAQNYQEADLVLPDGAPIHYVRTSPGTGWWDAVYEHTNTPTVFYKSTISWNGAGWDLKFVDGTVYVMGDHAPLQAIRDRWGNTLTIARSNGTTGNITQITSPNGRWIQFTYDGSNRITQVRDNVARTVNYTYDAGGRLWKVTNPDGGVSEYTYDIANQMLTLKDAKGIVWLTNEYDANGRVRKQILADDTPGNSNDNPTYQFTYTLNATGKVTQTDVTDPHNNINRVTFNADGFPLVHTYAAGRPEEQSVTYERQSGNNIILSSTDHLGRKTAYTRDAFGYITQLTVLADTADAVSAQFSYEPSFHLPATITDPLNGQVSFAYDSKGSLRSISSPLERTYTFENRYNGLPISVSNPLNHKYQFDFDGPDLVQVTDPLGHVSTRFTDGVGRTLAAKNPSGLLMRFQYDALSRVKSVTDPLQGTTSFDYDANSNVVSVTDARTNATTYTYNSSNQALSRRDPVLHDDVFEYNPDGSLQQVTDRKGQVTSLAYDAIGRVTDVTFDDSSTITYTYDAAGRLTEAADSVSGSTSFAYDNLDRLTQRTTPQGVINYTYDLLGRRTSMTVAGQSAVSYTYDDAGRLTQITQGSNVVTYAYDAADRRTSMTLPNGVVTEYAYNAGSQLTGLTYKKNGTTLGTLTYEYDVDGRLINAGGSFARTNISSAVNSATYNAANRQISFGGQTLTFDQNGSVTSDGSNTYTWNARNQLVSIAGPGLSASFQYDAFGQRVSKTINGVTTSYLYDGANLVQEKSGGQVTANLLNAGVDELLLRTEAGGTASPIVDGLGSVLALTDASGAIQTEYTYGPFGQTTSSGSSSVNPSQYAGRENDGTGLYYYRARYYSPFLHRFISEDPIGLAAGPNLYAYVGNSPTNLRDPFGLDPDADPTAGIGAAIAKNLLTIVTTVNVMVLIAMSSGPGGPLRGVGGMRGVGRIGASDGLADLARFRSELGPIPGGGLPDGGVVARLDVGGQSFYGINAHGQRVTLTINAISKYHAEVDAFQQAVNAGIRGGSGRLFVDHKLCEPCAGAIRSLARQLGLDSLEVITPKGTTLVKPD